MKNRMLLLRMPMKNATLALRLEKVRPRRDQKWNTTSQNTDEPLKTLMNHGACSPFAKCCESDIMENGMPFFEFLYATWRARTAGKGLALGRAWTCRCYSVVLGFFAPCARWFRRLETMDRSPVPPPGQACEPVPCVRAIRSYN